MKLQRSLQVPCAGINHADFSADLSTSSSSCEFSGKLVVIDRDGHQGAQGHRPQRRQDAGRHVTRRGHGMPAAPRTACARAPARCRRTSGSPPTAAPSWWPTCCATASGSSTRTTFKVDRVHPHRLGAHGIYPSRDAQQVYVSNRDAGQITVLDAATPATRPRLWKIPGGGSPDMGGVTADGSQLWLAGRYDGWSTSSTPRRSPHQQIPVDAGPHGLLVWPQPGRFSLGHTGNTR